MSNLLKIYKKKPLLIKLHFLRNIKINQGNKNSVFFLKERQALLQGICTFLYFFMKLIEYYVNVSVYIQCAFPI